MIYHTHSDESFEPTSGTHTKYWGDIYDVGETLADTMNDMGYNIIHSRANHNPHDAAAYERSRRTVTQYLKEENPIAFIDVHRDSVPAEEYEANVDGEPMVKILKVVGRQNQNRDSNLEFAKTLKAQADEVLPGISKGILMAKGNYNQDIGPKMLLLEIGTYQNTLEEAQKAAERFAQMLPAMIFGETAQAESGLQRESLAGWRSALWVIGLTLVGIIGYMAINRGSLQELKNKLGGKTGTRGRFDDDE